MSTNNGTVERVRRIYEGFARGQLEGFVDAVDPDIVWVEPEGVDHAGIYRGRDTVLRDVLPANTAWENHRVIPQEFIGDANTVIVLGQYHGRHKATGGQLLASFAHVWRFDGAERAVKFEAVIDTGAIRKASTSGG